MDSHQGPDALLRDLPESPRESPARDTWRAWGDALRLHHLDGLAAWFLEAGGPLALVSAQLLHMAGPFLGQGAGHLARILESESETADFIRYLDSNRMGE